MSRSKIEEKYYYSSPDKNYHHLEMHVSGSNGAVAFQAAPDIDSYLNIYFNKESRDKSRIVVSGWVKGDNFPANETILQDKAKNHIVIGVSGPNAGKNIGPYTMLWGDVQRNMYSFQMTILFNDDETFKGVELNGKQFSLDEWNKLFSDLNPKSNEVHTTTNNSSGTTEIKK